MNIVTQYHAQTYPQYTPPSAKWGNMPAWGIMKTQYYEQLAVNNNCLGSWYSDYMQQIQGNSCKVSEPSVFHLNSKLGTLFRLSHVFILPLHDLCSISWLLNKILLKTNTYGHFHPPNPVQNCLISTHILVLFLAPINCQQIFQSGWVLGFVCLF